MHFFSKGDFFFFHQAYNSRFLCKFATAYCRHYVPMCVEKGEFCMKRLQTTVCACHRTCK